MLASSSLTYSYAGGPLLSFPDISVEPDSCLLILGESGSGKTTLLQIIAGMLPPKSGEISVAGKSLYTLSNAERDQFRGRQMGLVFQKSLFIESLTVIQNLQAAAFFAGKTLSRSEGEHLLERLNINDKADSLPQRLSVGEQQRAGIAAALVNEPQIILADEPTSALDDIHAEAVYNLLTEEANRLQAALVVVTHDQRLKDKIQQTLSL
ncbi:MAG TPA: ATP-binding cassette domain-containing protein [Bacteroidales bacterium]|nr:ATP-binding cassette domain-containing protein [Bacteroidales bacterium]